MIEGRPSATALFVASSVIILGVGGFPLLPPGIVPYQRAVLEAAELPLTNRLFLSIFCSHSIPCRLLQWIARKIMPPDGLQFLALRKSYMEKQVRGFLERGNDTTKNNIHPEQQQQQQSFKKQVLILGAGYDTLALRLTREYPQVRFWEIDHPATGYFKDRLWKTKKLQQKHGALLVGSNGEKPPNLFHAHVDLIQRGEISQKMLSIGPTYNPNLPTIVVMEGLISYFSQDQIRLVFDQVAKVVGPGSVVAFSTASSIVNKQGQVDFGWFSPFAAAWVRSKGEPWLLGLHPDKMKEFFDETLWKFIDDESNNVQTFGPNTVATVELCQSN